MRRLLGIDDGETARGQSVDHVILDPIDGEIGLTIVDPGGAVHCAVPYPEALIWGPLENTTDGSSGTLAPLLEEPPVVCEVRTVRYALPARPASPGNRPMVATS